MKVSTKIIGMDKLTAELRKMGLDAKQLSSEGVVVGFTQRYAIYVHEVQARHKPGKQWKFLESPFRTLMTTGELMRVIKEVYLKTKSLTKALLVAGLRIQRQAQLIVPIDTGALKASAFTTLESKLNAVASMAFKKSEAKRAEGLAKQAAKAVKKASKKTAKKASKKK